MTAKQKAKELVNRFKPLCIDVKHTGILDGLATVMNDEFMNLICAKQCALIAVNEIISANPHSNPLNTDVYSTMGYWQEVKQEIENL